MAVKPIATSHSTETAIRGSGKLDPLKKYVELGDSASYYYAKLKQEKNKYLKDDMWVEAAKRGESDLLGNYLSNPDSYTNNDKLDQLYKDYDGVLDYDNYMAALAYGVADNTTKIDRTTTLEDGTEYSYGKYTDKEWAGIILDETFKKYNAQLIEESKKTMNFFEKAAAWLVNAGANVVGGALEFGENIYNVFEGIANVMSNQSGDEDIASRFLWAFSNDPQTSDSEALKYIAYDYARKYTSLVNAETAYKEGFNVDENLSLIKQINSAVGVGAGYTTWGKWWTAGIQSIGYMLPTMLIPTAGLSNITLGGIKVGGKLVGTVNAANLVKQGLFYTGIFSGNIKDTIGLAVNNGQSYKSLNAGEVIGNAALKAGAQLAIEKVLGLVMGFSGLDKMMGTAMTNKTAEKVIDNAVKTGIGAGGVVIGRFLKDSLKEGLEEFFQDMSDGIIDNAFGGIYQQRGIETLNIENLIDSFVVGALTSSVTTILQNTSVIFPGKRTLGVDAAGKIYRMKIAQTLNYRQALSAMEEWRNTANDNTLGVDERLEAATKLTTAINTLGSVIQTMGLQRAIKANQILSVTSDIKNESGKEFVASQATNYANNLYNSFIRTNEAIAKQFARNKHFEKLEKFKDKIKKAITANEDKMKAKHIDEIDNIITTEATTEVVNNIDETNLKKLIAKLKELGCEVLIGTDGNIVTQSGEIVIVGNELLKAGDIAGIVRGLAYDNIIKATIVALKPSQKSMILKQYNQITNTESTLEDALTGLLFDKLFYTKMLLRTAESKHYNEDALTMLATIDKMITSKTATEQIKGKLNQQAYKALLNKVRETMRVGLVTYATQYVKLDLGEISNDILSADVKNEIKNHRNYIFSEMVDIGIRDKSDNPPSNQQIENYDNLINQFSSYITAEEIAEGKEKARSPKYNERLDAYITLIQLSITTNTRQDKLIYLPSDPTGMFENTCIVMMEDYFGVTWNDLLKGTYDNTDLTKEAGDAIKAEGVRFENQVERLTYIRKTLFIKSGGVLTIDNDGIILKVLEKSEFLKEKYSKSKSVKHILLGIDGREDFKKDYEAGKIKTVQDISKVKLPEVIGSLKIRVDPTLGKTKGYYVRNDKHEVVINKQYSLNTLMHELTHATQEELKVNQDSSIKAEQIKANLSLDKAEIERVKEKIKNRDSVFGGSPDDFNVLSKAILYDMDIYLSENFPLSYKFFKRNKTTTAEIVYFMLAGELQANTTFRTSMFELGFRWKDNKQLLVSPDGKKTWSMARDSIWKKETSTETKSETKPKVDVYSRPEISKDTYLFTDKQYDEDVDQTTSKQAVEFLPLSVEEALQRNNDLSDGTNDDLLSGLILPDGNIRFIDTGEEHSVITNRITTKLNPSKEWTAHLTEIGITLSGDFYFRLPKNITRSQQYALQQLLKDYPNKTAEITYFPNYTTKETGLTTNIDWKNSIEVSGKGYDVLKELTNSINVSKDIELKSKTIKGSRYINNKVAMESNLKYFIKKGKPILRTNATDFIISTTNDFNKLPKVLQDKITSGKLTGIDIIDYVSTASFINEYTFKAIAKYVYNNEALSKLNFKEMQVLRDDIDQFAILSYISDDANKKLTIDDLKDLKTNMYKNQDDATLKAIVKATKKVQTVRALDKNGKPHYYESKSDPLKLNNLFFRHYDGTLNSLNTINNFGKFMEFNQQTIDDEMSIDLASANAEGKGKTTTTTKVWNWVTKMKKAEIDYESDSDVKQSIETLDRVDKINELSTYMTNVIAEKIKQLPEATREAAAAKVMQRLNDEIDKLDTLSDEDIDARYIKMVVAENNKIIEKPIGPIITPLSQQPKSTKNRKDRVRVLASRIKQRIAGLKTRYNILSPEVKQYIDVENKYNLKSDYQNLSDDELDNLIVKLAEDSKALRARMALSERAKRLRETEAKRTEKLAKKVLPTKKETEDITKKKTVREKTQVKFVTKIKEQSFEFTGPNKVTELGKKLLDTNWNKSRMSKVKGLSNNQEQNIANGKIFFKENAESLMSASASDIEETARWFLTTKMNNVTDEEYRKFAALKMYYLGFVLSETGNNKLYSNINPNLKQQIEAYLKTEVSTAGTLLSVWNNIQGLINPIDTMKSADIELNGVLLTADEKTELFDAAESGDIDNIKKIQQKIIERVDQEKTSKKSLLRRITAFRSMMMLSSPLTWLRNKVSNMALLRINKLADKLGKNLWKGKSVEGQFKFNQNVTPEIQKFIVEHFIDNKLFDTIVSNLSRYNASDIDPRLKDATGKASSDVIFAQMVIKSMYSEYYNTHMFNSKFLNSVHQKLMKMLSDNSYVREAAIRYFGKIIAERGYDLDKNVDTKTNKVSDNIMNDFGSAIGLALSDYMHSSNMFNKIETWVAGQSDKAWGEVALFAYKTILPFASAGWQWAKAALKLSPLGLGRAIINMARLETRVASNQAAWAKGEGNLSPELTQYIAKRELGQGVIGTIGWIAGALLAGLGYISLGDDDYGTPKLRIGNLVIDVSDIFGSSSLLAGAALITGINDKGLTLDGFVEGLNRSIDVTIDNIPIMQIVEMDMYTDGGFSMGMKQLENIALSYIPNILSWIAGATYSGTLKKTSFLSKAAAKIPFLAGLVVEKKVDPYTGNQGSWWDAISRIVPYFSIDIASTNESKSKQLGLNKKELNGTYTINGEEFKISGSNLTNTNKLYGSLNASDLTKFYDDKLRVRIKIDDTYKELTYSQLTTGQRKKAVQTIMSNNSELAKIAAWISAGNLYYASDTIYKKLRAQGISTNLYLGSKGFVTK